jgi:hypothetical protein
MFAGKAGAYLSGTYILGTPLMGGRLASSTNIRLDWKGLPRTNTLVFSELPSIDSGYNFADSHCCIDYEERAII